MLSHANRMIARWMSHAARRAEATFKKHDVQLTLGGEPTFVPVNPEGAEWNYDAVGPTKLRYAWKVAGNLQQRHMADSAVFFCPGKSYPGEVNPRWVAAHPLQPRRHASFSEAETHRIA